MNSFAPLLKTINEKLNLPQPTKSKIVLEIAADLDDLFHLYVTKGLSENEARKRAAEKFDVSDEALAQLVRIHETGFRKFIYKLSEQAQTRWERVALFIILLLIIAAGIHTVTVTQYFHNANFFIWLILGIAFVAIIFSLIKFYNLYIKKDHNIKKLQSGLPFVLFLAGLSPFVGGCGYFMEIYSAGRYTILPGITFFIETFNLNDSGQALISMIDSQIRSSFIAMTSLLVTILVSLIWFILMNKVLRIERVESEFLLAE
jgi:hypothetical protein